MMCDLISWLLKQVDNTRGWTLERETARKAEGEREILSGCGSPLCQHFITAE